MNDDVLWWMIWEEQLHTEVVFIISTPSFDAIRELLQRMVNSSPQMIEIRLLTVRKKNWWIMHRITHSEMMLVVLWHTQQLKKKCCRNWDTECTENKKKKRQSASVGKCNSRTKEEGLHCPGINRIIGFRVRGSSAPPRDFGVVAFNTHLVIPF